MKAHDNLRVSTLKMLSSELHNYQIDHREMTENEELSVVKREAKKRKDSIEAYQKGNLPDRVAQEEAELKILQEFLPAEISDSELEKIVDEVIMGLPSHSLADAGKIIGLVMQKTGGNADGAKVANLVRVMLERQR